MDEAGGEEIEQLPQTGDGVQEEENRRGTK